MSNKFKLKQTSGPQKKKHTAGRPSGSKPGLFQQALALHQAGRLAEAEALYRQILQTEPDHPDALHYLGILAHQVGKNGTAVELISKALRCSPDYFDAHINLAIALKAQGKLDEAVASFQQALKFKPNHAEALNNLGIVLHDQGKLDEAVASFQQALTLKPDYAKGYFNLGTTLKDQGKFVEAIAAFRLALTLKPDYAEALNNLGIALKDQGKMDEAVASFRQALTLNPNYIDAYLNLGIALKDQGKLEGAVNSFRRALSLRPNLVEALNNLGNALQDLGYLEEAIVTYHKALTLKPDYVEVHFNLGNALQDLGKREKAVDSYRQALSLKPDYVEAHNNLGMAFEAQGKLEEAAASYRQAITLKTDFAEAYCNLGNTLLLRGNLSEATASCRQALILKPDYLTARSNLLFYCNYLPGQSTSQYLEEARNYGRQAAAKVRTRFSDWICPSHPERLCIGVVSGDFRNHPVGYFLENLLINIDPQKIDLIAYPTNRKEDELTGRIRSRFVVWKQLTSTDDATAAHLIHGDGVHILLDLSGHTRFNRLPIFAWKPAPVQAAWLGYFASTGLAEMDYIIADPVSVPEASREQFTEKVWYLPETRVCFSPPVTAEELALTPLPALHNGYITFGSFQNLAKQNDAVLAVWGEIFQALPQARLRLQNRLFNSPTIRQQMLGRLNQYGIAPERVRLEKQAPRMEYLAAHAHIDIILDTFPFPGGTTTCEALWMGVPTVTLAGNTMIGRQGASLLSCAGLADWVAIDEEDYMAKASAHAADLEKLARLRAGLRQQVLASPLYDGSGFARNFETTMWGMWRRFQADK